MNTLPHISGKGKNAALYIDGKPFFMRSGEVHNSSASSLTYMDEVVWPAVRGRNLNSLIVPVYWECIEPEEDRFDFTLVDGLIQQARREGMKLELLWFGIWKNCSSTYVPAWVKEDRERFWYTRDENNKFNTYYGGITFILSPFCQEAIAADKKAFVKLMEHLKETDSEHTVILVQVENEMGIVGAKMDYSPTAHALFAQPSPEALARHTGRKGTWQEAYGKDAEESFMAWYYATATEEIAAAGKAVYPLPMGVNAWLEQEPWIPGMYPSGGPQYKNHEIWHLAAPSIDLLSPDIYVPYFRDVCREYATEENPLFIPECRTEPAFYLYAVGEHNALCFAPFGIEDAGGAQSEMDEQTMALLRISPDVHRAMQNNASQLFEAYGIMDSIQNKIQDAHKAGRIRGFLYSGQAKEAIQLPQVHLDVMYEHTGELDPVGGGLVIELENYEFLVAAINCAFDFQAENGILLDIITKEDGQYENGIWHRSRILNGDERYHHVVGNQVAFYRFKLLPVAE